MNTLKDFNTAIKMLKHDYTTMNVESFNRRKSKLHDNLNDFIKNTGSRSQMLGVFAKAALYGGGLMVAGGVGVEVVGGLISQTASAANGALGAASEASLASSGAASVEMLTTGATFLAGAAGLKGAQNASDKSIEKAQAIHEQINSYRDQLTEREMGNKNRTVIPAQNAFKNAM